MNKARYIALTDINPGIELDDVQSMHRLLLYANEIDIEGLVAVTSCFVKRGARKKQVRMIYRLLDGYEKVKGNLDQHAEGYPDPDYLRSVTCCGIPAFGAGPGDGFAEEKYKENPGVRRILDAASRADDRQLWIGLWGGANTLAQAIWTAEQQMQESEFGDCLKKLRIYSISDQDHAGRWIRKRYGDRLFYIVTPSPGDTSGSREYYKAVWPGISADRNGHGSIDGISRSKGFFGADYSLVSKKWLKQNIQSQGIYGRLYPGTRFIMEGDTPSFLGLIPNGLNIPEHLEYGGWGGRYRHYIPEGIEERYPIWTNASDTVKGVDGEIYTSPQATIWRWRMAFQNDYAARMQWTLEPGSGRAVCPPVIRTEKSHLHVKAGSQVTLQANRDYRHKNDYELVPFVINDGLKHPCALICPGGGYTMVCSFIEGIPYAEQLNKKGYSAFILYYHVREKAGYPAPQQDVARALGEIFSRADEWNIDTECYSVWGSSAGGHLAASFGTDEMGYKNYGLPKPGALILSYPVVAMGKLTHKGSRDCLLGKNPDPALIRRTSVEEQITPDYPPVFFWCGDADRTVPPDNSRMLDRALTEAGVEHEFIEYPGVDHGVGLGKGLACEEWFDRALSFWENIRKNNGRCR